MTLQLNGRRTDPNKHRVYVLEEAAKHCEEAVVQAQKRLDAVKASGPSEASLRDATQAYEMAIERRDYFMKEIQDNA